MWKFGFWSIGCILAIACIVGWYRQIHVPKRMINQAVETTANHSSLCELADKKIDADLKLQRLSESKDGLTCRRIDLNDAEIEICQRSLVNQNANDRLLKQTQLKIRVRSQKYLFDTDSIVDIGGDRIAFAERDIAVVSSKTHIYFGWARQLDAARQYAITVRAFDRHTGEQQSEKEVHRTDCCIVNLSMHYEQHRSKLLFAWNNWSYPDDSNLFFGQLDVNRLQHDNLKFTPTQLVFHDRWDKRNPYFLQDGDKIYLIYTTGDHWGWLAYSGRRSIGVYVMDDAIQPVEYRIIAAQKPLGKVLKIENGDLCYELLLQDASRVEALRKIHISKAFKAR